MAFCGYPSYDQLEFRAKCFSGPADGLARRGSDLAPPFSLSLGGTWAEAYCPHKPILPATPSWKLCEPLNRIFCRLWKRSSVIFIFWGGRPVFTFGLAFFCVLFSNMHFFSLGIHPWAIRSRWAAIMSSLPYGATQPSLVGNCPKFARTCGKGMILRDPLPMFGIPSRFRHRAKMGTPKCVDETGRIVQFAATRNREERATAQRAVTPRRQSCVSTRTDAFRWMAEEIAHIQYE